MPFSTTKEKTANTRDKIFTYLRIFISAGLLLFLILRNIGNFKEVIHIIEQVNIPFMLVAILFFTANLVIGTFRWDVLLRAQGPRVSRWYLLQSVYVGYFYNNILPSNIGGDFYRVYDISRNRGVELKKSISSALLERFMGLISLSIYLALSFVSIYKIFDRGIITIIIFLAVAYFLFTVIIRPKLFGLDKLFKKIRFLEKFGNKMISFSETFDVYGKRSGSLVLAFTINMVTQVCVIFCYYFVNLSLGLGMSPFDFFFIVPIIFVVTGIPISIGGLGVRENILVLLLGTFGITNERALVFSFLVLIVYLFKAFVGGIVYLFKSIFYRTKGFV